MMFPIYEMWCDHFTEIAIGHRMRCRSKITLDAENRREAVKLASKDGWVTRKGPKHYCPQHKDTQP
jgi:hypothetical protein